MQGTLDLLILKTLRFGPCHGQGVARSIQRQSEEVLFVDHGSLYVALQRLEDKKWIRAKWGVSENNRKARFYSLTAKGREQLTEKTSEWRRLMRAMGLILDSAARAARRGGVNMFQRKRSTKDFAEEIKAHLDLEADDLREQGLERGRGSPECAAGVRQCYCGAGAFQHERPVGQPGKASARHSVRVAGPAP